MSFDLRDELPGRFRLFGAVHQVAVVLQHRPAAAALMMMASTLFELCSPSERVQFAAANSRAGASIAE